MSLIDFAIPQTKSTQLQSKITGQLTDASLTALANVTLLREQMFNALKSAPPSAISAIKDYLPALLAMSQQESKNEGVRFEMNWNSVVGKNKLSNNKDTTFHTYTRASEELAHVFFTLGLLHYRSARLILKEIPEQEADDSKTQSTQRAEARKEGVRLLREAAGIFEYAPSLDDNDVLRPLDTRTAFVKAMQMLCLTNAQEMLIISAVEGKKSRALIAKLCLGASEKFAQIRKNLGVGLGNSFHNLKPQVNLYLKAKAELYDALAKGHLGYQSGIEEGEHGKAIGYYKSALAVITQISIGDDPSGGMEEIRGRVQAEKQRLQQELNVEINDNDKVYFMKVPKETELEISASMFNTTAISYVPPTAVSLLFFERPAHSQPSGASQQQQPTIPVASPAVIQPRVFACAACTSHFSVNCTSGSTVRCPICSRENLITY